MRIYKISTGPSYFFFAVLYKQDKKHTLRKYPLVFDFHSRQSLVTKKPQKMYSSPLILQGIGPLYLLEIHRQSLIQTVFCCTYVT